MNCSFGSPDSCGGSFGKNSSIVPLMKCDEDMSLHFLSLGIGSKRGVDSGGKVSEVDVLLNRFGVVGRDPAEMSISLDCWIGLKERVQHDHTGKEGR